MTQGLSLWNARAFLVAEAARRRIRRRVLRFVRSVVEDAGGEWTEAVASMAGSKIDAILGDDGYTSIVHYHATDTATRWPTCSAPDDDLPRIVNRTVRAIGPLMRNSTSAHAIDWLLQCSAGSDRYLSPEVCANIRARISGDDDADGSAAR